MGGLRYPCNAPLVAGIPAGVSPVATTGVHMWCVARAVKTADHHIQNAYRKIGVSTRAAATLFAMEHGLVAWGELPIARPEDRS